MSDTMNAGCKVENARVAWKDMSQDERDAIKARKDASLQEAQEGIQRGVEEMLNSTDFDARLKAYFDFHSQFHSYSFNNSFWLMWQAGIRGVEVTQFASFKAWRKLGRRVRKGEKGFEILTPLIVEDRESKARGDKPVKTKLVGFKLGYTFDISQTDPTDKWVEPKHVIDPLTGEVDETFFEAVMLYAQGEGLGVNFGKSNDQAHGWYQPGTEMIFVKEQDRAHMLKTLCHEIAHAKDDKLKEQTRTEREAVAEGAAYIIARHFGVLDTSPYSFSYIAAWLKHVEDGAATLRKVMNQVVKVARTIIDGIEELMDCQAELDRDDEAVDVEQMAPVPA